MGSGEFGPNHLREFGKERKATTKLISFPRNLLRGFPDKALIPEYLAYIVGLRETVDLHSFGSSGNQKRAFGVIPSEQDDCGTRLVDYQTIISPFS
jgi:hypothetical protein